MRNPGTCILYISMTMALCTFLPSSSGYKLRAAESGGDEDENEGVSLDSDLLPGGVISSRRTRWDAEPSCEELRAMWHFSKRQSRATEITNEIPTYRDPFAYNIWEPYARSRSSGMRLGGGRPTTGHVYGRVVHTPPRSRTRVGVDGSVYRNYEEVAARLIGAAPQALTTGIPRRKVASFRLSGGGSIPVESQYAMPAPVTSGSFQQVKDLIRSERARELQEQRLAEEEAARAAALRGLTSNSYYGQIVHEPPNHNYEALHYDNYDKSMMPLNQRKGSVLAFPDLLAPTSAKYADQFYRHRSYQEPMPERKKKFGRVHERNWAKMKEEENETIEKEKEKGKDLHG